MFPLWLFTFGLAAAVTICLLLLLRRPSRPVIDFSAVLTRLDAVERAFEKTERCMREDLSGYRSESGESARLLREELHGRLQSLGGHLHNSVVTTMSELAKTQGAQLTQISATTDQKLEAVRNVVDRRLQALQEDNAGKLE